MFRTPSVESMDDPTLATLRDEYPTASWALWSSNFPDEGCLEEDPAEFYEFVQRNRDRLRPSVVLLSLNPSTELPSKYRNFHSTDPKHRNDQFRDLVENAGLEGAYMTDLVERVVDAKSKNVEPTRTDVDTLFEQLELLDQDQYYILCFHRKVFQALKNTFDATARTIPHEIKTFTTFQRDLRLRCYRVWFHANWGANKDKIPALQDQMSFLRSNVIESNPSDFPRWNE